MKVLIACEESQTVYRAFRERGYEAYSCGILEPPGYHPEWHIHGDALQALNGGDITTMNGQLHHIGQWGILIAHPPCTYLSNAGNGALYKHGEINQARYAKGATRTRILHAILQRPNSIYKLLAYSQVVQPY